MRRWAQALPGSPALLLWALLAPLVVGAQRLTVANRTLLLDGSPFLARGIAYSPTPIGVEPSGTQSLDFFKEAYAPIFERDLPLMSAAGINMIRIYSMDTCKVSSCEGQHTRFFQACAHHNISIMGGFELDASHHDLRDDLGFLKTKIELQEQLNGLLVGGQMPSSVVMWNVGNEINLKPNGFVCDADVNASACQFNGTELRQLFERVDELCDVVASPPYNLLCSSPLADNGLPESVPKFHTVSGSLAWMKYLDPIVHHIHVWTANVYGSDLPDHHQYNAGRKGPFGDWFDKYSGCSERPVLLTEFGIDAFDTRSNSANESAQAWFLQSLVEQIERNAATCLENCDSRVASGGIVFTWSDEWFKGHGPPSNPTNGPWGTPWWYNEYDAPYGWCPDWSAEVHSPCGYSGQYIRNNLDNFWNEEWFGIFGVRGGCGGTTPAGPVNQLIPRLGYYALGALWAYGGCSVQALPPPRGAEVGYNARMYDGYPSCTTRMAQLRAEARLHWPNNTDCDYQRLAEELAPGTCPPIPPLWLASVDGGNSGGANVIGVSIDNFAKLLQVPPPESCSPPATTSEQRLADFPCTVSTSASVSRLQRVPGTFYLLLDCVPWLMRAISYSPVPWNHDPSYIEPYGDYFTDQYKPLFTRDMDLFVRMGVNTIRLYAWRQSTRHGIFLDEADRRDLVVVAVYEMGTAEDTPVSTVQERSLLRARVQSRVRVSKHRAIVAWLVGNELNGAWNEYVCENEYARKYLAHDSCVFGESAVQLCRLVDSLCQVVKGEGYMCSTPFAGVNPPAQYIWGEYPYGLTGWVQVCEGKRHAMPSDVGFDGVQYVDFWAANLYPGRDFGDMFDIYANISSLPLMVAEFGIDAFNTNCNGPDFTIGCEDEQAQAVWLMSLVEDIERHASACAVGCVPESRGRVAVGGAVIGWADEWWKGRVIDAVEFDNRTEAMGSECPDPYADVHSPCGYPSYAQPDKYVNEEWFGILAIHQPCANDVDQLRAREAWFRLKLLWKEGGCLSHFSPSGSYDLTLIAAAANLTNKSGVLSGTPARLAHFSITDPNAIEEYPNCGARMTRLREDILRCEQQAELYRATGNISLVSKSCRGTSTFGWDGTDCALQTIIYLEGEGDCPPVPTHMANLSGTVATMRSEWEPVPSKCPQERDLLLWRYVSTGITTFLVILLIGAINHRMIIAVCWRNRTNRIALLCATLAMVALALLLVGLFNRKTDWAISCYVLAGICLALVPLPCLPGFLASQKGWAGGVVGPRNEANPLTRKRGTLTLTEQYATSVCAIPAPASLLSSQQRAARDATVRKILMPIAAAMAEVFTFQTSQEDALSGTVEMVPSNLDNTIDHLVILLAQRLDRQRGCGALEEGFAAAFEAAVGELHSHMISSYERWVRYMGLRSRTQVRGTHLTIGSFAYSSAADFGKRQQANASRCVCNMRLHRLVLFMLMWGEAANVRHLPECLSLIFYCASNALIVRHPSHADPNEQLPTPHSPGAIATFQGVAGSLAASPYLSGIIQPIYDLLSHQILRRRDEDISTRVMYDDVNEFFWDRVAISTLLPSLYAADAKQQIVGAYAELCGVMRRALQDEDGASAFLMRALFQKTYRERISWLHLIKNYRRIFGMQVISLHVMIVVASNKDEFSWRYVSTSLVSYSCFAVIMHAVSVWTCGASRLQPWRALSIIAAEIAPMLLHLAIIATFVVELYVCGLSAEWLGLQPPQPAISPSGEMSYPKCFSAILQHEGLQRYIYAHNVNQTATGRSLAESESSLLHSSLGMKSIFEVGAFAYVIVASVSFIFPNVYSSVFNPLAHLGLARGQFLKGSNLSLTHLRTRIIYTCLWLAILTAKWSAEYNLIVRPAALPSKCLWTDVGTRFYCWGFNAVHGECSFFVPNITVGGVHFPDGRGFGDAFPEWGLADGPGFSEQAHEYLTFLRNLRALWYRLMLIFARWATPVLVCFADTALIYNVFAAFCSYSLASYRKIYHTHSWSSTVNQLPQSVRLFNEKLLAPREGVELLPHYPRTLEWFLWEAPTFSERLQRYEPSLEAVSTEWRSFALAWNLLVESLRASDYLSDNERNELVFEILQDPVSHRALGPSYVVLPTMLTSPVCTRSIWRHKATNYASVLRTIVQARDLAWYVVVQLGLVRSAVEETRQSFLCALTCWAEQQELERELRQSGDPGPLLKIVDAIKAFVQTLIYAQKELAALDATKRDSRPDDVQLARASKRRRSSVSTLNPALNEFHTAPSVTARETAVPNKCKDRASRASTSDAAGSTSMDSSGVDALEVKAEWRRRIALAVGDLLQALEDAKHPDLNKRALSGKFKAMLTRQMTRASKFVPGGTFKGTFKAVRPGGSHESGASHSRLRTGQGNDAELKASPLTSLPSRLQKRPVVVANPLEELTKLLDFDESNIDVDSLVMYPSVVQALHRSLTCTNPGSDPRNIEARRQLMFFCNSLHNRQLRQPPTLARMRSWTSFTPHYSEDVSLTTEALNRTNRDNTSLVTILKALHTDEWNNLKERVLGNLSKGIAQTTSPNSSVHGGTAGSRESPPRPPALSLQMTEELRMPDEVRNRLYTEKEVERWASDRSQVLSRTVRGVMRYGQALRMLAALEGVPHEECDAAVSSKFEYVVACQIYHGLRLSSEKLDQEKADHIDELRREYPENLRVAYVEVPSKLSKASCFSSVLLGMRPSDDGQPDGDKVLYKVRLPGNPIVGEGKPENQNHAIIFTRGEHLQTLDMNQDNYMGESYKMRNLLECFQGNVRIVGFREHIFSESGGAVAKFAASNEFVFGTMVQRFLTWPLMVRFHYGHPDVWDKVWALSSGGISKASKTLHVSEDIFGGLNVVLRGHSIEYLEYIHCGKARDITFTASNAFEQKISGGNAYVGMSRDFCRIGSKFDLFRLLSAYVSGTGLFVSSAIMYWSLYWFVVGLALFSMVKLEKYATSADGDQCFIDVVASGDGGVMASLGVIQLGLLLAIPQLLEYIGCFGLLGALQEFGRQQLTGKIFFTIFAERTRVYYLNNGLSLGSARYIATGRSFITMSSNFVLLYTLYARSHFLGAAELVFFMIVYYAFTMQSAALAAIVTLPVWLVIVATALSPWLFNPRAFQGLSVYDNLQEFLSWLDPDGEEAKSSKGGWAKWHAESMRAQRSVTIGRKASLFFSQKLPPKLCLFTAATAALHIDVYGDGAQLNFAFFRVWITISSAALYVMFTLLYGQLAYPRFLHELFAKRRAMQAAYLWALRFIIVYAFLEVVWILFAEYMSATDTVDPVTLYVPSRHNSMAILVAAVSVHVSLVQMLAFISEKPKRCGFIPKPLLQGLQSYSDGWYRDGDMMVGQSIGFLLLVLGVLPLGFLHSRLLFNRMYAASIERLQRQRELLLLVSGTSISLTDVRTITRFVVDRLLAGLLAACAFTGWLLSLFGLRESAIAFLKQTWCWPRSRADINYSAMNDTDSGRFVPSTEELASCPDFMGSNGIVTSSFLAHIDGPEADLRALGVVNERHVSGDSMPETQMQAEADYAQVATFAETAPASSAAHHDDATDPARPAVQFALTDAESGPDPPQRRASTSSIVSGAPPLLSHTAGRNNELSNEGEVGEEADDTVSEAGPGNANSEWIHEIDPNSGRAFYKNTIDGTRTWAKPAGFTSAPQDARRVSVAADARRLSFAGRPAAMHARRVSHAVDARRISQLADTSPAYQPKPNHQRPSFLHDSSSSTLGASEQVSELEDGTAATRRPACLQKGSSIMYTAAVLKRDKELNVRLRSLEEESRKEQATKANADYERVRVLDERAREAPSDKEAFENGFELPSVIEDEIAALGAPARGANEEDVPLLEGHPSAMLDTSLVRSLRSGKSCRKSGIGSQRLTISRKNSSPAVTLRASRSMGAGLGSAERLLRSMRRTFSGHSHQQLIDANTPPESTREGSRDLEAADEQLSEQVDHNREDETCSDDDRDALDQALEDIALSDAQGGDPIMSEEVEDELLRAAKERWRIVPDDVKHSVSLERSERLRVLRSIVGSMAYDMANIFGFQKEHPGATDGGPPVLSSVANQVEHLVFLLSNRMDALESQEVKDGTCSSFMGRLHTAIAALHEKVLTNYENWVRRLQLRPEHKDRASDNRVESIELDGHSFISLGSYNITLRDFASLEEGNAWIHNAQLQRLTLFFLMHGEAANLRHVPECLCFIFYTMLHSLMVLDTREQHGARGTGVDFQELLMYHKAHRPDGEDHFQAEDFLHSIVTPIYKFIQHEVAGRAKDPVMLRVMYDDVTECFWQQQMIQQLLPLGPGEVGSAEKALHAYPHLRRLLAEPSLFAPLSNERMVEMRQREKVAKARWRKAQLATVLSKSQSIGGGTGGGIKRAQGVKLPKNVHPLRPFFGKTYIEKPGWAHCYHVFGRILLWHAIFFHGALVLAFYGSEWQYINRVCITHATGKILRQLIDMHIGHPPRSVDSAIFDFRSGASQSLTEHVTFILLFALVPIVYLIESTARRENLTLMYDVASYVYVGTFAGSYIIHTKPGYRLRSLWRKQHETHIGSDAQLRVPLGTFVTYCTFWAAVLSAKLAFDYWALIYPLKQPVDGLLNYPFDRLMWRSCSTPPPDAATSAAAATHSFCFAYERFLRWMLVMLRVSVPFLVFYFDTYIFFNIFSAVFSAAIALRRRIGVVSHWRHVIIYLHQNVRDFNLKLLGTNNGDSARAAAASARSLVPQWSIEARSLEWQCFARAWNTMIDTLRDTDALSNMERDELLFFWLSGDDSEPFFEVPEYIIFPTFITSPVLTAAAVPLQQGARAVASLRNGGEHAYASFVRTMQQTRDLLLWLLVQLHVVPLESRSQLLECVNHLASLEAEHLLHSDRKSNERAKWMVRTLSSFIQSLSLLLDSHGESSVVDGQGNALADEIALEAAAEIKAQVLHMVEALKRQFLDSFDARSVTSNTNAAYRSCVDAWDKLQQLVNPDEEELRRGWAQASKSDAVACVVSSLYRSMCSPNPGCEPQIFEAKRQILFFCNSLFNKTLTKPPPVTAMKSWTAFTPHYAEDVTYSMKALREETGINGSLQALLTSLFPEEWQNFCERVGLAVLNTSNAIPADIEPALQQWASDRAQVLSRTVRGVMRYGEALRVLARLEGVPEDDIEAVIASKFEYCITCQIYGRLKAGKPGSDDEWKAQSIDALRRTYAHNLRVAYVDARSDGSFFSVLLGVDPITLEDKVLYKVRLPGNPIVGEGKPENQNHAIIFTRGEHLQTLDMNQDNYMGESYKMRNLLECFQGNVRIVGFREHIFSESGGAVAKFAASNEFVFGTMVQRFLTWPLMVRFHYGHPDVWDKVWALSSGGISKASKTLHVSEDIFAGFNAVLRGAGIEYLEYIHCGKGRDMGFTAVNGFEMKISAGNALQCTSRDLYRLGKNFDLARLMSFYFSGSGFYITTMMTISSVFFFVLAQLVLALCGAELFEFQYESDGHDSVSLAHRRLQETIDGQLSLSQRHVRPLRPHELALSGDTLSGLDGPNSTETPSFVSASGSIYSAAYLVQLGWAMMLPYFVELWVESSLWRALVASVSMMAGGSFVFSLFTMQTKGFHFSNAITFGRAGYVATGRGFQMDTIKLIELYAKYAESHIHKGFEILLYLGLFWTVTEQASSVYLVAAVPVILLIIGLMLSPWIFNPGALTFGAVWTSWRDWRMWIDSESNDKMADINWTEYHKKRMASARSCSAMGKVWLGLQATWPRVVIIISCSAYLRSSRTLVKYSPGWSVAIVMLGVLELGALGIVHILSVSLIHSKPARRFFPKRSFRRFLSVQLLRIALVLAWFLLNWAVWESFCWSISCSTAEADLKNIAFDAFTKTGSIPGYSETPRDNTALALMNVTVGGIGLIGRSRAEWATQKMAVPRACDRVCATELTVLSPDFLAARCISWAELNKCAAGADVALDSVHPDMHILAFESVSVQGMEPRLADCLNTTLNPDVSSPETEEYSFCMSQTPNLGVLFVGAIAAVVILMQWLALIDMHGWEAYLHKKLEESRADGEARARIVEYLVVHGGNSNGMSFATLADVRELGMDEVGLEKTLTSLTTGPWRSLRMQPHGAQVRDAGALVALVPEPQRALRTRLLIVSLLSLPQHLLGALAISAAKIADFHYRLFDLVVALVTFTMLVVLTLLPLHSAQSMLLFNANFWRVIERAVRITDFLEELYA